jgi:hypothetical protein
MSEQIGLDEYAKRYVANHHEPLSEAASAEWDSAYALFLERLLAVGPVRAVAVVLGSMQHAPDDSSQVEKEASAARMLNYLLLRHISEDDRDGGLT